MKKRANVKQKNKAAYHVEGVGEVIGEQDITISLYAQYYSAFITDVDELVKHITKNGVAQLSINVCYAVFEPLARWWFVEWANNIGGMVKSPYEFNEYHRRYSCKLISELARAIKEKSPNNQQAQNLAGAITRISREVGDAIDRGTRQYMEGKGKPQPADLLSDTRHGALWDSVENAIAALSTAQAETPLSNAEICAAVRDEFRRLKRKSGAKETKKSQRERAAQWLKAENAAGRKTSIVDAARHFKPEIQAEKIKGGYTDADSLMTALNKDAAALGIEQFIRRRKNTRRCPAACLSVIRSPCE